MVDLLLLFTSHIPKTERNIFGTVLNILSLESSSVPLNAYFHGLETEFNTVEDDRHIK